MAEAFRSPGSRRLISLALVLALTAGLSGLAAIAQAKPPDRSGKPGGGGDGNDEPPAFEGLLYASDVSGFYEISPDGSGGRELLCARYVHPERGARHASPDLSHATIAGERWFVFPKPTTDPSDPDKVARDPNGFERAELVVFDYGQAFDAGACSHTQISSFDPDHPTVVPMNVRWAPDGAKMAIVIFDSSYDAPNTVVGSYDLWIAQVDAASGIPQLTDARDLVPGVPDGTTSPVTWSSDSQWVAYVRYPEREMYAANVSTGQEFVISPDPAVDDFHPSFAPEGPTIVGGSLAYRLAFMRPQVATTPTNYLFAGTLTVDQATGVPLGTIGDVQQITSKKTGSIASAGNPAWSPDGAYLAFSGTDFSLTHGYDVYRVRSDGKGKAVVVTEFLSDVRSGPIWRTGP